jgi:YidC/Oxa1 family membrane protein insertase
MLLYNVLVLPRYQTARAPAGPTAPGGIPAPTTENAAPEPAPVPESTPPTSALAAEPDESTPVTVDTDHFRLAFTPRGARLAGLELKDFRRTVDPQSPPLDLVTPGSILPLTLQLGDESDARVTYTPDRTDLKLQGAEQGDVVFTGAAPGGGTLEKRFHFSGDGYVFELRVKREGGPAAVGVGVVLTPIATAGTGGGRTPGQEQGVAFVDQKIVEKSLADLQKQPFLTDGAHWAGFTAQYFLTAILPESGSGRTAMGVVDGTPIVRLDASGASATFDVFAGPKDRDVLTSAGHDLGRALDFGWFWFIAIPLLRALRILYGVTGNYGVAIIVLTALVKLATTPLTQTTFRNMREMQKLQPQMARLREKHKDDQMALQKEMMELYKRHHVNPFAGCLPMVLQLPIFVGLYNTLLHSIELRHAPFMLWINDLSAPDRLLVAGFGVPVLTLLMGASMFLQQWLSPQQGDPTQQRMMMIMPLMFTFMFMNFPAGLVLYWLVNNVLTIGQQYMVVRSGS